MNFMAFPPPHSPLLQAALRRAESRSPAFLSAQQSRQRTPTTPSLQRTYMPISSSVLSQSIVNERMVALCGVSKGKSHVQEMQSSLEQRFLEIYYPYSTQNTFISIQWAYKERWQRFCKLPLFYKRAIASRLESILRSALPDQYPSTAQLCLVATSWSRQGISRD